LDVGCGAQHDRNACSLIVLDFAVSANKSVTADQVRLETLAGRLGFRFTAPASCMRFHAVDDDSLAFVSRHRNVAEFGD
jgi:hypothetical protein